MFLIYVSISTINVFHLSLNIGVLCAQFALYVDGSWAHLAFYIDVVCTPFICRLRWFMFLYITIHVFQYLMFLIQMAISMVYVSLYYYTRISISYVPYSNGDFDGLFVSILLYTYFDILYSLLLFLLHFVHLCNNNSDLLNTR